MSRKIKAVQRVSFHRNGVAGSSFYTVEFTMRDGRATLAMLAVVSNWSPVPEEQHLFTEPFYAVVTIANPGLAYRGDEFWPELRDAIARAHNINDVRSATAAWATQTA